MMLYKVVRRFQSVNDFLNCDHLKTPLNESTHYFPVVMFVMLRKV